MPSPTNETLSNVPLFSGLEPRDLAEVVPGPECRTGLATDAHGRVPVGDDEEARAAAPLARHRTTLREAALLHLVRETGEVLVVQVGEEGHIAEYVDGR